MARPTKPPAASGHATLLYPLVDGYVHHWLAFGPIDISLKGNPDATAAQAAEPPPDFEQVMELARVRVDGVEDVWEVRACAADHWLAWHGALPTLTYRRAWGYVELFSAVAQRVTLVCTVQGAVRLWVNGQAVTLSRAEGEGVAPRDAEAQRAEGERRLGGDSLGGRVEHRATVDLHAGANPLLVRVENTTSSLILHPSSLQIALRVENTTSSFILHPSSFHTALPTVARAPRRRQRLEALYAQARLDRAVYTRSDPVRLLAPVRCTKTPVQLRLQKPSGAIYGETVASLTSGAVIESVRGSQLPNGSLDAVVMAPFQEFYQEGLRARHITPILIANQPFHPAPEGSRDQWLVEALQAQVQQGESIYAELAKMAFGWWGQVDGKVISGAVARVADGAANGSNDALPDLLGLVTLAARMPAYRGFPTEVLPEVQRGLARFMAQPDGAAWDEMTRPSGAAWDEMTRPSGAAWDETTRPSGAAWDTAREASQLATLAARHLAAQLDPQFTYAAPDAAALVAWLAERGRNGFQQWHSDHALLVMALAPLVSLAQDGEVREAAASLLDIITLSLAQHHFQGNCGASRAEVTPATLRSGRFAPEAALHRLLWGTGGFQTGMGRDALAAVVALGLAGNSYALPETVRDIALAQAEGWWMRERQGDANLAAYRTPDTLLCARQDGRALNRISGARGSRELLWQATLGPEAVVFTTHPGSFSQHDAAARGWWVGNDSQPQIAQHHDALIARYVLPADSWLRFTHAYFPVYAFDEVAFVEGWAFGRVGDGYVALAASPRFTLIEQGPDAGRELRVEGERATWLCQMGRRATDGAFADFQRKMLATSHQADERGVTWTTIRGETLTLAEDGAFTVNGQVVSLDNYPRHSSPFGHAEFPAEMLEIVYGDSGLRLRF